jgi:diguanylate cyclase (GGDEF)-like protein/PAS domain S-box-containing protein
MADPASHSLASAVSGRHRNAWLAAALLLYIALGVLTLLAFKSVDVMPIVWPSGGVALAALLLAGRVAWPVVSLGALAACLLADYSWTVALGVAAGETLAALVVYGILHWRADFNDQLESPRDFLVLLIAAAIGTLAAALLTGGLLTLGSAYSRPFSLAQLMLQWQSAFLGIMLFTPLILVWRRGFSLQEMTTARLLESSACLLLTFSCGQIVLVGWGSGLFVPTGYGYWLFLFVAWAAVRCGRRVVLLTLVMILAQSLIGAFGGGGLFAIDLAYSGLSNFWFFFVMLSGIGITLAALLTERDVQAQALQREKQFSDDIIASLPGAFYMLDEEARMVRWNAYMQANSGYSDEELMGMPALDLVSPASQELVASNLMQAFTAGQAAADAMMLTKSGEHRPYSITARRSIIDGRMYLVGIGEDIAERKRAENALRESEIKYRQLFENLNAHVCIFDQHGVMLMTNESNARALGGVPSEFIGKSLHDLFPRRAEVFLERYRQLMKARRGAIFEDAFVMADGVHWYSSHLQPLSDLEGNPAGMQIVSIDITERKRMEESLRHSEELWKFALEGAGDSVWDWNVEANTVVQSPRWKEMMGYAPDDEVPDWLTMTHPEDRSMSLANRQALIEGHLQSSMIELRMRCKDGRWKWILSRGMIVKRTRDGKPVRLVGTNADVTLFKEQQQKLEHIAHYDPLCNLPNRVLLGFRLQQAMSQCQRRNQSLAVAYLDLDGFKAVNDTHGHDTGDQLLVALASRMKTALREGDTLARIGGDEFIAVLADLDQPEDCEPVLVRLLAAAAAPVMVGALRLQVSASVGVTIYPRDSGEADQLMRHADQAMYQAKQAGKNRYHLFDIEHDAAVQIRRESIDNIRRGLAEGEFVLHYQPKVNMRTGQLVGVEALIRWQHPQQGLLAPAVFLPIIDNPQIMAALGEWVMLQALAQIASWQTAGLEIPISVNIDARHLQQPDFVRRLADALARYPQVDPAHLELEILETNALEDVLQVSEIMHACRSIGVAFSLDDFGTGYSSLTYLRRLPIEQIKIDQSFVRDMLDDVEDLTIVEGVIGLALAFHRQVIAEGVESVAHGELLLQLGCELGQGYGIARPMAADDLFEWAAHWRPDDAWTGHGSGRLMVAAAAVESGAASDGLALVLYGIKHRQWQDVIEGYLSGGTALMPQIDEAHCAFGRWLDSTGRQRHGSSPDFDSILEQHRRLHGLGRALCETHLADGPAAVAAMTALRAEMAAVHDGLEALLQRLE